MRNLYDRKEAVMEKANKTKKTKKTKKTHIYINNKKVVAEIHEIKLINFIRIWLKDNRMSDSPIRKQSIDLWTKDGEEIVKDILSDGFKYVCDIKHDVMRYVPPHQILTIYFYGNKVKIDEATGHPMIFRV